MKRVTESVAIDGLRWVLGVVVLVQSLLFLLDLPAIGTSAHSGMPAAVRLILGWSEILAAILFMIPSSMVAGSWSLLIVFTGAIVLHIAHRDYNVGGLLVYSAAVLVVMTHRIALKSAGVSR